MNKRIHWNRFEGVPLPQDSKRVDRGTRFGNPYKVSEHGRTEALKLYETYLRECIKNKALDLSPLVGMDLACSCKLSEECQGDILLRYVNDITY
jgi:hypothetical protein